MQTSISSSAKKVKDTVGNVSDAEYKRFLTTFEIRANTVLEATPAFTTSASPEAMWNKYLGSFPVGERQFHNCNSCKKFIQRFGGLVTIDKFGTATPLFWGIRVPALYRRGFAVLNDLVSKARVNGVFLSSEAVWGDPVTGIWRHFSVAPPRKVRYTNLVLNADQAMAAKQEDFRIIWEAFEALPIELLDRAVVLLRSETMFRSEKVLGHAEWLLRLRQELMAAPTSLVRHNLLWAAVEAAPAGFCHPRGSMIGTLLEDLEKGLAFETVKRKFAEKMDPAKYQRPQAAPAVGNIRQAEDLVEKMGIKRSLERRYAKLEEVKALWTPTTPRRKPPARKGGVFGHLMSDAPAAAKGINRAGRITWRKFYEIVLQNVYELEFLVPGGSQPFCALATAVYPSSPPILQWDSLENRNPVSWYLYTGGSLASRWGLSTQSWVKVPAITQLPSQWNGGFEHQGDGVILILQGARDRSAAGVALFPEILKSELHGVRATIEAHSNNTEMAGLRASTANGYMFRKGETFAITVRADMGHGVIMEYVIDRWD